MFVLFGVGWVFQAGNFSSHSGKTCQNKMPQHNHNRTNVTQHRLTLCWSTIFLCPSPARRCGEHERLGQFQFFTPQNRRLSHHQQQQQQQTPQRQQPLIQQQPPLQQNIFIPTSAHHQYHQQQQQQLLQSTLP